MQRDKKGADSNLQSIYQTRNQCVAHYLLENVYLTRKRGFLTVQRLHLFHAALLYGILSIYLSIYLKSKIK